MAEPLTLEEVRRIAHLARLRCTDEQLECYRHELAPVLDHLARLRELDLEGVEPLTGSRLRGKDVTPGGASGEPAAVNRMDDDEVAESMPLETLMANAPARQGPLFAVPKVLGEGEGA